MSRPRRNAVPSIALAVAVLAAGVLGVGCASKPPVVARGVPPLNIQGSAMFGTFVKQNEAVLKTEHPAAALYSVGDAVYLFLDDNTVYALSGGLDIRYIVRVADSTEHVRKPVLVKSETVFPTTSGISVYNATGASVRTIALHDPITSNANTDNAGNLVAGTAAPTGGMVTVFDPTKLVGTVTHRVLVGNVVSAPVVRDGTVFVATTQGGVYAIDPRDPPHSVWGLPGKRFQADDQVTADLFADDFGLYVASTDTKLYVLDRGTGKIKWRFAAQSPLRETPLVTKDAVYQVVPGSGLAALSKTSDAEYHDPLWMAPRVTKVLSADDKYVYAVQDRDRLVALGKDDGKVKFSVAGKFDYFVAGPDNTLYAATRNGALVSFKRGTYTGDETAAAR